MLRAVRDYNAQGFTTFMDGGIGLSGSYKTDMAAYLSLARDKALDARGYLQFMPPVLDAPGALRPVGFSFRVSEFRRRQVFYGRFHPRLHRSLA